MTRDRSLRLRVTTPELERWRAAAETAEVSLSVFVRRAIDEAVDLQRALELAEAEAERRARRLHELDPSSARTILERRDPPYQGGSRA